MCYWIREQQAGAAERGDAPLPPSLGRLRPRLIGVAAALIGGLAVAAIAVPPSSSFLNAKDSAAPLAAGAAAVPTAAVVEQGSAPVDDGVPNTSDGVKAGIGHCDHGL
jgi:hypothetical protein